MTTLKIISALAFLILIILSIYNFIKSKKNENDEDSEKEGMRYASKIYNLMIIGNVLMFYCIFLVNNFIYEYLQKNIYITSSLEMFALIISWLPIIIFIPIVHVYTLTGVSDKFKNVLPYIYIHLLILIVAISTTLCMGPLKSIMSNMILNVLISVLFILSIIFQMLSIKGMKNVKFYIKHEFEMANKTQKKYDSHDSLKEARKNVDRVYVFYLIVIIIEPHIYFYYIALIIGTVIISKSLNKMRKEYLEFEYKKNKYIIIMFLNYYICAIISIFIYKYSSMGALLMLYLGIFTQYLFVNKVARKRYMEIEKMEKE